MATRSFLFFSFEDPAVTDSFQNYLMATRSFFFHLETWHPLGHFERPNGH
jgi:hypothetical protein